jgi:histidyl-tRNA synthetase
MQSRKVGVKPLRDGQEQVTVSFESLSDTVLKLLSEK